MLADEWAHYDGSVAGEETVDVSLLAPKLDSIAQELFYRYDLDGSGVLDRDEVQMLITNVSYKLGAVLPAHLVDDEIAQFYESSTHSDHKMTKEHFVWWYREKFQDHLKHLPKKLSH